MSATPSQVQPATLTSMTLDPLYLATLQFQKSRGPMRKHAFVLAEIMLCQPGAPLAISGKQVMQIEWRKGMEAFVALGTALVKAKVIGKCPLRNDSLQSGETYGQIRLIGGQAFWKDLNPKYQVSQNVWSEIGDLIRALDEVRVRVDFSAKVSTAGDLQVIERACTVWASLYREGVTAPLGLMVPAMAATEGTLSLSLLPLTGDQVPTFYHTRQKWSGVDVMALKLGLEQLKSFVEAVNRSPESDRSSRQSSRASSRAPSRRGSRRSSPEKTPVGATHALTAAAATTASVPPPSQPQQLQPGPQPGPQPQPQAQAGRNKGGTPKPADERTAIMPSRPPAGGGGCCCTIQ